MTDITELKIENEEQLIELLSENVVAPYMLLTEICNGFMEIEVGYVNTQPLKVGNTEEAHAQGKVIVGNVLMVNIIGELLENEPTNVNIDVTCDGYIRFFSRNPDKKLMWATSEPIDGSMTLKEIARQDPQSEAIVIGADGPEELNC